MARRTIRILLLLFVLTSFSGTPPARAKDSAEFVGRAYAHQWQEGIFAGAVYEITFMTDNTLRWEAKAGQQRGRSAVETYKYVKLSPALHQFSWNDGSAGYFFVLTYDFNRKTVHGIINTDKNNFLLKGVFSELSIE